MNIRALLLDLVLANAGCTATQSARPAALHGVLRVSYIEDIHGLNPHLTAQ